MTENKNQAAQFQLLFEVNDTELLRYNLRLDHFSYQFLRSEDLFYTLRNCCRWVKEDLISKSRIYSHYIINRPVKLTGFVDGEEPTYFLDESFEEHSMNNVNKKDDEKQPKTFKFSFICNGKPSYEEIFDATDIPNYVFDKFNLFNNLSETDFSELVKFDFQLSLMYKLQLGKENIVYKMVDEINNVAKEFIL